jgi:hypothetical protein
MNYSMWDFIVKSKNNLKILVPEGTNLELPFEQPFEGSLGTVPQD